MKVSQHSLLIENIESEKKREEQVNEHWKYEHEKEKYHKIWMYAILTEGAPLQVESMSKNEVTYCNMLFGWIIYQ